jgi:hypothetical protein
MTATNALETGAKHGELPRRARRVRLALGIVASILYLIIRTHIPIAVHAESIHDDQLFISMGQRIADGHWLGAYNQMTLIKGPGYPLFLAANAWLGTPLSLAEALFLGLGIGVFFLVFARISRMPNVALFGYIATLWMPAPYLERIMRDCIYPGQMLLVISGLIALLYLEMPRNWRYACALATGLLLGWFSLTREEGIWIAPGIAVIALAATIHHRRKQQTKAFVLAPVVMIIAAYGATQLTFLSLNRIAYGSFIGVEVNSSPFRDAMSALQSVQAGEQIPYVPVSRHAREAIYKVSPSFLKLKGYFDPPTGSPWQFGCQFYAQTCGEIAGGWFMWALRDAVATNGFYDSPKKAAAFYRGLTNEVQTACRAGQLQCKPLLISILPRIAASQWANFPTSLLRGLRMVTLYTPSLANIPSSGPAADLMTDMEFLGSPARTSSPGDINIYSIHGWYYGAGKKGWITGKIASGNEITTSHIVRADSPDLVSGLGTPDASHQRFNTTINCQAPCIYSFVDDVGATVDIHLAEVAGHPSSYPLNGATLNIDQVSESSSSSINAIPRYRLAAAWREIMEKAYGHVLPWLLPLSLLAMSAALVIGLRRRALTATTVLAMTLWVLFASRLTLLTLVDISSFPAMVVPYLSPAYLLACITPIISFAALYELLKPSGVRRQS